MNPIRSLTRALGRFRRDEEGSIAVETVLMVPFLAWAMLSTLTYFDAYRAQAIAQRASLTIADMYSRETDYITPDYLNGTRDLLRFLTIDDEAPDFRVTAFEWQESKTRYRRVWSKNRGAMTNHTNATLALIADKLPTLDNGEVAILVETEIEYEPPFAVGLESFTVATFTVTSPRFATTVCWNPTPENGTATEVC